MSEERLQYKLDFMIHLEHAHNSKMTCNIIVCGDVNTAHKEIDLARPKENKKASGFYLLKGNGLIAFKSWLCGHIQNLTMNLIITFGGVITRKRSKCWMEIGLLLLNQEFMNAENSTLYLKSWVLITVLWE